MADKMCAKRVGLQADGTILGGAEWSAGVPALHFLCLLLKPSSKLSGPRGNCRGNVGLPIISPVFQQ